MADSKQTFEPLTEAERVLFERINELCMGTTAGEVLNVVAVLLAHGILNNAFAGDDADAVMALLTEGVKANVERAKAQERLN